jgi:glycosyltransferase involved in cell wall biosynthesis
MHIALVGPIAGEEISGLLHVARGNVPRGCVGAPLTGILIGEFLRLGHRVTGITTDSNLPLSEGPVRLEGPSFTFVVCPARPRAYRPNGWRFGRAVDLFAFERRALSKQIVEAAPDIVHAHWSYEFALAALSQETPHLITCHDSPAAILRFNRNLYRALRYLMAQRVFRLGRAFTTVSDYMARELAPMLGHLPAVVPNPVAAHVFALGRPRSTSAARRVAMVCNGWDKRKNAEVALIAFAQWRQAEAAAELHLYGAQFGEHEAAQRWAKVQGLLPGLHFHGSLPHRELARALAGMDALLHSSLEESFGVVLAEAMALGLPIVAGNASGAVPWVLGANTAGETRVGVLADVTSPAAIAAALRKVFDSDYTGRSLAGIERASHLYAPERIALNYEALYRSVLRGDTTSGAQGVAA